MYQALSVREHSSYLKTAKLLQIRSAWFIRSKSNSPEITLTSDTAIMH